MTDFIPPYPYRHPQTLGPLETLKYLRKDLLSFWTEHAFSRNIMSINLFTRTLVIANCPEAVEHVLVHNPTNYEQKTSLLRKPLSPLLGESLLLSNGDIWQQHSQTIRPFFGPEQLAKFCDVIIQTISEFQKDWGNLPSTSTLAMVPEMKTLSAAILCRILFGEQVTQNQCQTLVGAVNQYLHTIEDLDVSSFFGLPNWIPNFGGNKSDKAAQAAHRCIDNIIAANSQANDRSLLGLFLSLPSGIFSPEQVRNELLTFFLSGYETTANTLAWVWYLISQCPEVEQRLHHELDNVLGSGTATAADVPKLAYTRAIIAETLRLYPPFPLLSREIKNDDSFNGRPFPGGSTLLIVPWLLHRHKKHWDNPDHFIPERFFKNASGKFSRFAYLPYGLGARECIAKHLSAVEMTLCLAMLARRFRLQTDIGQKTLPICRVILRPDNDVPMRLHKR